jgi:hypothetical protein
MTPEIAGERALFCLEADWKRTESGLEAEQALP